MVRSVRPSHAPACAICPRNIRQKANQNEHLAAAALSPESASILWADSHADAQVSSSPIM